MSGPTVRPLADTEMSELVRVETEWQRRAHTTRPWSIDRYLDNIAAVHARYAHMRRYQQKQATR